MREWMEKRIRVKRIGYWLISLNIEKLRRVKK